MTQVASAATPALAGVFGSAVGSPRSMSRGFQAEGAASRLPRSKFRSTTRPPLHDYQMWIKTPRPRSEN